MFQRKRFVAALVMLQECYFKVLYVLTLEQRHLTNGYLNPHPTLKSSSTIPFSFLRF